MLTSLRQTANLTVLCRKNQRTLQATEQQNRQTQHLQRPGGKWKEGAIRGGMSCLRAGNLPNPRIWRQVLIARN
ncbi:MAG: hypothetical protein ACKPJD_15395, partial [Planctomycetaceae bacterium]